MFADVSAFMSFVKGGVGEASKIMSATKENDYLEVAIILLNMALKYKNRTTDMFGTFLLEDIRPQLQFMHDAYEILNPKNESRYYSLNFDERFKIVLLNFQKTFKTLVGIKMEQLKYFAEQVQSGEFQRKVKLWMNKFKTTIKEIFKDRNKQRPQGNKT